MLTDATLKSGAHISEDGTCRFRVWAPFARSVAVHIVFPDDRVIPMRPEGQGWFVVGADKADGRTRYYYRLEADRTETASGSLNNEYPDPASRFQPDGVHGPSQVVADDFTWHDRNWRGLPLEQHIIYELHVGTFTAEGTLEAIIRRLDMLVDLGVTAVELMPIAQFPGKRNWGYDGVYPFAVQNSYGGPRGLKTLIDACHGRGLAVILDVVYNHLGPEGNYLRQYGPYFTDFYRTPWGEAINFDGPHSDHVRRYFTENVLQWLDEFHVDALRLDAVHAILDFSARPFLEELGRNVHALGEKVNRQIYLFAESALNDTRIVRSRDLGGFALDAQWNDDFHHALHTVLTGEKDGYYQDFGKTDDLARSWSEGFVYSGQYSCFRQRCHGNNSRNIPARRFIVFSQNHDQVGNRMRGERSSQLMTEEKLKLAAAAVLLSPYIPLLFMGQEYGEKAPFQYFVSHGDPDLVDAVRRGRRREFEAFNWLEEPPDPQDEMTFRRCKINPLLRKNEHHRQLLDFYRELIRLRRRIPALFHLSKKRQRVFVPVESDVLYAYRWFEDSTVLLIFNFGEMETTRRLSVPAGKWIKCLDSGDGQGARTGPTNDEELTATGHLTLLLPPHSFRLYERCSRSATGGKETSPNVSDKGKTDI